MILTNELKALIVSRGLTQAKVAERLKITPKTFYTKMKKGVFMSDEIDTMIEILQIDEPIKIFFARKVT